MATTSTIQVGIEFKSVFIVALEPDDLALIRRLLNDYEENSIYEGNAEAQRRAQEVHRVKGKLFP